MEKKREGVGKKAVKGWEKSGEGVGKKSGEGVGKKAVKGWEKKNGEGEGKKKR